MTMAPGNLTISDSSRRRLSCYLDVGRHDTRIDNITSISDVERSNAVVAPASFVRTNIFSPRKRFVSKRFLEHLTIASLQIYLWFSRRRSSRKSTCTNDIRLSFETYSSTRSLFLIIYYPELIIKYFSVSFFYRNTRRNVYPLSMIQEKRENIIT